MKKTIVVAVLAILLGSLFTAPPASASTGCVWITDDAQGNGQVREPGSKECTSWSTVVRISEGGNASAACAESLRVVLVGPWAYYCEMNTWSWTTSEPAIWAGSSGSKTRDIADSAKRLAASYGLVLQFSRLDGLGRAGCPSAHPTWLASNYWPSGSSSDPGYGLIRIGLGDDPEGCLKWWNQGWNAAKHEIAHALIERTCGTTSPPIMQGRLEPVTGAYSALFLGNTDDTESDTDKWRATQIREGRCE